MQEGVSFASWFTFKAVLGEGALKLVHKGYSVFIFDRIDIIYKNKKTLKNVLLRLKK